MMRKKQQLLAQEQEFALDVEIAKAKARERAYQEDIEERQSTSSSMRRAKPKVEESKPTKPVTVDKEIKSHRLDPQAPSFLPQASEVNKNFLTMQQEQNAQMLAAHRMLATAVSLPQPEVTKFKGDPIEYNTFISSFESRIASLASTDSDRLYYLEQHLQGEARELIGGCMYMEPSYGYHQALSLLAKEYGDHYKVSMGYVSKALSWPTIKYDDASALKKFSFFLIKCQHAMQSISHMTVLNHAPNMQSIVQKLPSYLQNKWRDTVVKMRMTTQKIAEFSDLVRFIQQASESANDPIYGKESLSKTEKVVSSAAKSKTKAKSSPGKVLQLIQYHQSNRARLLHQTAIQKGPVSSAKIPMTLTIAKTLLRRLTTRRACS